MGRKKKVRKVEGVREVSAGISASEFKDTCLDLIDRVNQTGEEIVVTKYGQPMAKLVPYEQRERVDSFGILRGTVTILGDIVGPTGEKWDAEQ